MSNRNYEKAGHLVDKDGVRREIKAVCKAWIHLQACALGIPVWAADCMEYEPPKRDEWLTEEDREIYIKSSDRFAHKLYNRILEARLGKPSEWVRKRDVARAVWDKNGKYHWDLRRMDILGITPELAKEAGDE